MVNKVASKENANAATPEITFAPIQVECQPLLLPPLPASSTEVKHSVKNAEINAQVVILNLPLQPCKMPLNYGLGLSGSEVRALMAADDCESLLLRDQGIQF